MKITKILPIAIASIALSSPALADLYSQAGDIEVGKPYELTKGDTASYYKEGKSGSVTFNCTMQGDGSPMALVYPGKNFVGNVPHHLNTGDNGPYTWSFKMTKSDVGNIKVKLIKGKHAVIACKQVF